eukprot:gene3010-13031_t
MLLLGIAAAIAAAVALIFLLVDRNRRQRLAQGAALVSRLETLQQLSDLTTVQQYHQAAAGARAISMNRSWEPLVSDGLARELAGGRGCQGRVSMNRSWEPLVGDGLARDLAGKDTPRLIHMGRGPWVPGPCVYESFLGALVSDGLARELAGKQHVW